jgi:hypothetical protein
MASYLKIFHTYQGRILFFLGAHVHTCEIRSPITSNLTNANMSIFLAPSVSPYHSNNPGYSIMDLTVTKVLAAFLPISFKLD